MASSDLWSLRTRRWAIAGGLLATFSVVCGVIMLLMKWADAGVPPLLSQLTLFLLPLAFIAFMIALVCAVARRRVS